MGRSLILLIKLCAGQGRGKALAWEGGHSGKGNKDGDVEDSKGAAYPDLKL